MVRNSFCGKASEAVPPNLDCPRCGPLGTNNKSSEELQGWNLDKLFRPWNLETASKIELNTSA